MSENVPTEERLQEIAERVLEEGRFFEHSEGCEGTPASGPYSRTFYGFRWGRIFLEKSPGGAKWLIIGERFYRLDWKRWAQPLFARIDFVRRHDYEQ